MKQEVVSEKNGCYIPKQYIFIILGFFGLFNMYAMRVNLSVAMVAMTNNTEDKSANYSTSVVECAMLKEQDHPKTETEFKGDQYNWDSKTKGLILGAFFYLYIINQVPGGFLAEKIGGKWLFGGGVFCTSVLTLLTPLAAKTGVVVFVIIRIMEGFGEGATYPALNLFVSKWSSLQDRSRVSTIVFIGAEIGTAVSLPISGLLSSTDLFGGWPSVFYLFGTIGCIWFLLWSVLVYESPEEHPTISEAEQARFRQHDDALNQKKPATPWKAIFTSMPMWSVLVAHIGHEFGIFLYLTELPTYLSSILHFNIKDNGALSALPWISQALAACIASYIADKLRSCGMLSITSIRKIFNTIGFIGPAICLLGITVSGCRPSLIVGLLTLAMALNGFAYSGFHVTHVDMSPDFSGTLYGMTNTSAGVCGSIAPAIVGIFTSRGVLGNVFKRPRPLSWSKWGYGDGVSIMATIPNWNKVFYISAAIYIVGAVFYAVFASAELQPWGKGVQKKPKEGKNSSVSETRS